MTYLEMINNLLVRLRERTISTATETDYSTLLGILLNDAKDEVESAWQWSALRASLSGTTTADIYSYELNASLNSFTILDVMNVSTNSFMKYKTAHEFNSLFLQDDTAKGEPQYYSWNGTSVDGDTVVDVYPIPDGAYDLRYNLVLRQDDLDDDAEIIEVPAKPVLLLAYAKAIEERGEDSGVMSSSAFAQAKSSLSDAIALDANKHPEELIYHAV